MFKVGDKVIRVRDLFGPFPTSPGPYTITSREPSKVWPDEINLTFAEQSGSYHERHFDLYEEPKKSQAPKYAVGDEIMPAKIKEWQRPVIITAVECKFIYRTDAHYLDNVPEDKVQPFVQAPRTLFVDGVLYKEVI